MLSIFLLLIVIGVVNNVFMDKKNDKGDEDVLAAVSSSTWDPETCLYGIKSLLSYQRFCHVANDTSFRSASNTSCFLHSLLRFLKCSVHFVANILVFNPSEQEVLRQLGIHFLKSRHPAHVFAFICRRF